MLGQPVTFLVPEVVGVHLHGSLAEGVTATDLTLRVTEMLRGHGVVGKFVEFYGPGPKRSRCPTGRRSPTWLRSTGRRWASSRSMARPSITCAAPGAARSSARRSRTTSRHRSCSAFRRRGDRLHRRARTRPRQRRPCCRRPKRPQDRIDVPALARAVQRAVRSPVADGGFGLGADKRDTRAVADRTWTIARPGEFDNPTDRRRDRSPSRSTDRHAARPRLDPHRGHHQLHQYQQPERHARRRPGREEGQRQGAQGRSLRQDLARARARASSPTTSRRPTCRRNSTQLGFETVGYGCTTCIGNTGPLHPAIEAGIKEGDLVCASVLSGNRNFEARVHGAIKANFLMSPPLVVAYALAGRVDLDLTNDPLGSDQNGDPVFLADLWPTQAEVNELLASRAQARSLREALRRLRQRQPEVGRDPRQDRRRLRVGQPTAPTSSCHHSSKATPERLATSRTSSTPARSASSATRSPPTTSARLARSKKTARPVAT